MGSIVSPAARPLATDPPVSLETRLLAGFLAFPAGSLPASRASSLPASQASSLPALGPLVSQASSPLAPTPPAADGAAVTGGAAVRGGTPADPPGLSRVRLPVGSVTPRVYH